MLKRVSKLPIVLILVTVLLMVTAWKADAWPRPGSGDLTGVAVQIGPHRAPLASGEPDTPGFRGMHRLGQGSDGYPKTKIMTIWTMLFRYRLLGN